MNQSHNHDPLEDFIKSAAKDVPRAPDHLKHQIRARILDEADVTRFFLFRPRTWLILASTLCVVLAAFAVMHANIESKPLVSDAELEAYLDDTVLGTLQSVDEDDSLDLEIYSLR